MWTRRNHLMSLTESSGAFRDEYVSFISLVAVGYLER
jgi:hypothetical protein